MFVLDKSLWAKGAPILSGLLALLEKIS